MARRWLNLLIFDRCPTPPYALNVDKSLMYITYFDCGDLKLGKQVKLKVILLPCKWYKSNISRLIFIMSCFDIQLFCNTANQDSTACIRREMVNSNHVVIKLNISNRFNRSMKKQNLRMCAHIDLLLIAAQVQKSYHLTFIMFRPWLHECPMDHYLYFPHPNSWGSYAKRSENVLTIWVGPTSHYFWASAPPPQAPRLTNVSHLTSRTDCISAKVFWLGPSHTTSLH
jgi:hypothetical protein